MPSTAARPSKRSIENPLREKGLDPDASEDRELNDESNAATTFHIGSLAHMDAHRLGQLQYVRLNGFVQVDHFPARVTKISPHALRDDRRDVFRRQCFFPRKLILGENLPEHSGFDRAGAMQWARTLIGWPSRANDSVRWLRAALAAP